MRAPRLLAGKRFSCPYCIASIFDWLRCPLTIRTLFLGVRKCIATSSIIRPLARLRSAGSRTATLKWSFDVSSKTSFLAPAITRTLTYMRKLFFCQRGEGFDEAAQLAGGQEEHRVVFFELRADALYAGIGVGDGLGINIGRLHARDNLILRQLCMRRGALRGGLVDIHFVRPLKYGVVLIKRRMVAPGKGVRLKDHHQTAVGEVQLHRVDGAARFFVA